MDLVHDIIAEEDRISNLSDEIIHRILSFLDINYAIQTSMLSLKWERMWASVPYLNLNSETFPTLPQFAKFMKHALSNRNNHKEVSALNLTCRGLACQLVVKSIVNYACSHDVREVTMIGFTGESRYHEFPQSLFSSHTLQHLTLATNKQEFSYCGRCVPDSAWDLPVLETLSLSNVQLGCVGDKSLDFFSKCEKLKDLILHRCLMYASDVFNICAPRLSNLTITDPYYFPKVFNVVAPKLENLTATVSACINGASYRMMARLDYLQLSVEGLDPLQLSTEGLDSLENVNLSMSKRSYKKERYVPQLLDLFKKLRNAKSLILDMDIIEALSLCMDQLSREPCPFTKLKRLKIDMQKNRTATVPAQVRNYFLESSPSATFIMDLSQATIPKYGEDITTHPRVDPELWTNTNTMGGGRKKGKLYNSREPDSAMTGGSSSTDRLNNASGASANDEVRQLKEEIEKTRVEMEVREQRLQAELTAWEQALQVQMTAREQALKAEMDANMEARMKAFEAMMFANIYPHPS